MKQSISMESEASEHVKAGELTRTPLNIAGNDFTKRKPPSTFVGLEPLDPIVWPLSRSLASLLDQISTSPDIAKYI